MYAYIYLMLNTLRTTSNLRSQQVLFVFEANTLNISKISKRCSNNLINLINSVTEMKSMEQKDIETASKVKRNTELLIAYFVNRSRSD